MDEAKWKEEHDMLLRTIPRLEAAAEIAGAERRTMRICVSVLFLAVVVLICLICYSCGYRSGTNDARTAYTQEWHRAAQESD